MILAGIEPKGRVSHGLRPLLAAAGRLTKAGMNMSLAAHLTLIISRWRGAVSCLSILQSKPTYSLHVSSGPGTELVCYDELSPVRLETKLKEEQRR